MQQGGPTAYAYVAANGYIWADYFFWEMLLMQ